MDWTDDRFSQLEADIRGLRTEFRNHQREVWRGEFEAMRRKIFWIGMAIAALTFVLIAIPAHALGHP
jgi:hypothetical protein